MFETVVKGFQPLIELAQAVSYPLTFFMMVVGGCQYIIGNEVIAKKIMKCAVTGYILVQIVPSLMQIVHSATKGMSMMK